MGFYQFNQSINISYTTAFRLRVGAMTKKKDKCLHPCVLGISYI